MPQLPASLTRALVGSIDEALERTVTSGTVLTSGLATSEPSALAEAAWDQHRIRV